MKKILITGGSGFIGSHIAEKFLNENYIVGVVDLWKSPEIKDFEKKYQNFKFYSLSVLDFEKIENVMVNYDNIIHLAAILGTSETITTYDIEDVIKTNVLGTYNIIDTVLNNETSNCMVISTTDKVYKNSEDLNNEESKLGGSEFYSSSKVAQEMVIESFKNSTHNRKLNLSTVRSGNVLGPGDGASDRLMTDLIKSLKDEEDIILRNPNSIRPWQDIMDSIYGYLLVAKESYTSNTENIFNLNTEINNEVTTKEIAEKAIQKWNSNINIVESKEMNFYEASKLRLDSSKAKSILGWKSKLNIDITLDKIVEWEKSNDQDEREKVSFNQIDDYFRA